MKVLFVGDIHGSIYCLSKIQELVKKQDYDAVVQVGDFGYNFAADFVEALRKIGAPIYFIHGNHDNLPKILDEANEPDETGFRNIWKPNLFYIPNGTVWEWEGVKFAGFGGATSVDRSHRVKHVSWWPEAETFHGELNETVDVFVSHDVPFGVETIETFEQKNLFNLHDYIRAESAAYRKELANIAETNLKDDGYVIHGHWHHGYIDQLKGRTIMGLDADGNKGWLVEATIEDGQISLI